MTINFSDVNSIYDQLEDFTKQPDTILTSSLLSTTPYRDSLSLQNNNTDTLNLYQPNLGLFDLQLPLSPDFSKNAATLDSVIKPNVPNKPQLAAAQANDGNSTPDLTGVGIYELLGEQPNQTGVMQGLQTPNENTDQYGGQSVAWKINIDPKKSRAFVKGNFNDNGLTMSSAPGTNDFNAKGALRTTTYSSDPALKGKEIFDAIKESKEIYLEDKIKEFFTKSPSLKVNIKPVLPSTSFSEDAVTGKQAQTNTYGGVKAEGVIPNLGKFTLGASLGQGAGTGASVLDPTQKGLSGSVSLSFDPLNGLAAGGSAIGEKLITNGGDPRVRGAGAVVKGASDLLKVGTNAGLKASVGVTAPFNITDFENPKFEGVFVNSKQVKNPEDLFKALLNQTPNDPVDLRNFGDSKTANFYNNLQIVSGTDVFNLLRRDDTDGSFKNYGDPAVAVAATVTDALQAYNPSNPVPVSTANANELINQTINNLYDQGREADAQALVKKIVSSTAKYGINLGNAVLQSENEAYTGPKAKATDASYVQSVFNGAYKTNEAKLREDRKTLENDKSTVNVIQ